MGEHSMIQSKLNILYLGWNNNMAKQIIWQSKDVIQGTMPHFLCNVGSGVQMFVCYNDHAVRNDCRWFALISSDVCLV